MARAPMHTRKSFVNADGETSRSAKPDTTALRFEFLNPPKDGEDARTVASVLNVTLDNIPDNVRHCAMFYGLSQKLGDSYSGAAKMAEALDMVGQYESAIAKVIVTDTLDDFANGVWVEERESASGTGNVTILLEAITKAFADAGKEAPADLKAKLADADYRKKARELPAVAAHVRAIELERAQARAKAAKAAAKQAGDAGLEGL